MTTFLSVHVIACMTKQGLQNLIEGFHNHSNDEVRHVRSVCDTIAGRMICEWRAKDGETLRDWLNRQNVRLRGDSEWIIRGRLDTDERALT